MCAIEVEQLPDCRTACVSSVLVYPLSPAAASTSHATMCDPRIREGEGHGEGGKVKEEEEEEEEEEKKKKKKKKKEEE